jgi:hypothetical protein
MEDDLDFLIGDNCATNKSVANKVQVKFIGCASHRLSLAGKQVLATLADIIDKMFALFVKLKTHKYSALLRQHTPLRPVDRNETRFNGTAEGISRFFQLQEHIVKIADADLTELMLSPHEV